MKKIDVPLTDEDWKKIFETLDAFVSFFRHAYRDETKQKILDAFLQCRVPDKFITLFTMMNTFSVCLIKARFEGDKAAFDRLLADSTIVAEFASALRERLHGSTEMRQVHDSALLTVVETMNLADKADTVDQKLNLIQQRCLPIQGFIDTPVLVAVASYIQAIACTDFSHELSVNRGLSLLGQMPISASGLPLANIQAVLEEEGIETYTAQVNQAFADANLQQKKLDTTVYAEFSHEPPEGWCGQLP